MKVSIIVFPGTNREKDMAIAFDKITGCRPDIVWHKETDLKEPDLIVLPGGFSYGDYLRCGAMAAHSPIMKEVKSLAEKGVRVLGVCNGFQMLIETRMLPGALLRNNSLKFICRQTFLRCENNETGFTSKFDNGEIIRVPIAHGEGNYFASSEILKDLENNQQIAFRYCNENGDILEEANPNGSSDNIAGIFNKEKTILGMMPHPEDAVLDHHDNISGSKLFEAIKDMF